ncbi:hypothetical protein ACP70R_011427 [Stipagrostis hirtigluma subsp. patula]
MAAPPSPRPPQAQSAGGDAPVSLFLDTDLGTRLALLVAPNATVRHLKSQVAAEHATAFPDLGPVAVKSFQVRRKGALYHLSDSMTLTSAFTRINGGCFLHVKMAVAAVTAHCSQDTTAIDGTRSSEGHLGIPVEKRVGGLPAIISEIASDVLSHRLEGGAALNNVHAHDAVPNDVLLPSSSQTNTETKKIEAVSLASDAQAGSDPVIDKLKSSNHQLKHANQTEGACINSTFTVNANESSNQSNMPHVVEEAHARKEDILHGDGDQNAAAGVSDNKQVRIEDKVLKEAHAMNDLSQEKERKKARPDSFDTSGVDPNRDLTKSSGAFLGMSTTSHGVPSNIHFQQEVHDNLDEDSVRLENPITVGKKKKKRRQLVPSEAICAQEMTKPSIGAVELSKSTGEASPDLVSAINTTSEPVASEGQTAKGSNAQWDGEKDLEQIEQHKHNEHDEGAVETSNMVQDSKSTDALEKKLTNDNTSQGKKRKKAKKVSSVEMASVETASEKNICENKENAAKSDMVSTEREIVDDPSLRQISSNVQQGHSNITVNPTGDGKRKKKRRRQSESSKGADVTQDLIKSSGFATNESSIHNTNDAPLDAKQMAEGTVEGTKMVSDCRTLDENLDRVTASVIEEVLTDLRSTESLSMDLDQDLLPGKNHLVSNQNAQGLPESTGVKVGVSAALPPKFPAAVHSDAPVSSPSHDNSKGLKVLSTMIDPSHYSSGVPHEDAHTELRESDSLRFTEKTRDLKDSLNGDVVVQTDEKIKATKRRRKKVSVKQDTTESGIAAQSTDERVDQVAKDVLKGVDTTQGNLVAGDFVIDTPSVTVGKVQKKGKRSSKTTAPKLQETNDSIHERESHLAKDSQDQHVIDIAGTHDTEIAAGAPAESPVVQKDNTTLKSASPSARKGRKKSSNNELQNQDSALGHDSTADLRNSRIDQGMFSPGNYSDTVVVQPASGQINFLDLFSSTKMNEPSVSAEKKQSNKDESARETKNKKKRRKQGTGSSEPNDILQPLLPSDKTILTGNFGASEVVVSSIPTENLIREDENLKKSEEKKKRKRKPKLEGLATGKENPVCDYPGTDIGTQCSMNSVVQKDNGKENNKFKPEVEDATCGSTLEKNCQSAVDSQNNLPSDNRAHIGNEQRKSTSETKPHAKTRNHDESINGRADPNPNAVSKLVKSFSMSPPASSDSAEDTPHASRFRVAVRKVPSKRFEQTSDKSKEGCNKVGSGTLFNDAISEDSDDALDTKSEKTVMEASSDNSTSADSGISSSGYDDGTVSLSQKSLKDGLHLGSILRGSSSYKKARQKQAEQLDDDDTEVPDSQPADGLWG